VGSDREKTGDVSPTVTLAKVYERQGLLHEAAEVYRALLALEPERSDLNRALKDIEGRLKEEREERLTWEPETVLTRLERWQQGIEGRKGAAGKRSEKEMKVMVIRGSKEDTGGQWEEPSSDGFGSRDVDTQVKDVAGKRGILAETFQSHDERDLVWKIEDTLGRYDVLIIDPGEYAHTSMTMREALSRLEIPIIEVHPSNTSGKGSLGQKSLTADVATAHLAGFGIKGFTMALEAATNLKNKAPRQKGVHNLTNSGKREEIG
jgi:3-dehydroquinate dehydratase-2